MLPIEEVSMPEEDIGDLSDVVDAINKLCDTMKTSYEEPYEDQEDTLSMSTMTSQNDSSYETASVTRTPQHECSMEPPPVPARRAFQKEAEEIAPVPQQIETVQVLEIEAHTQDLESESIQILEVETYTYREIEPISEEVIAKPDVSTERWSDSTSVSLPGQIEDAEIVTSDTDNNAQCEPTSEMYYTASSEVSLLSDTELPDNKVQNDEKDDEDKDDRKNVIAGHVAAMRERFESMTRTNTPCPDLVRSLSPSLEVFRNASPSPDRLA